jgi:hypothetical protein
MTRAISRILLSLLSFPLASLLYLASVVFLQRSMSYNGYFDRMMWSFSLSGAVTWCFLAAYWYWLWRRSVRWTPRRVAATAFGAAGALVVGVIGGILLSAAEREVGVFIGSTLTPLVWLGIICVVWRETEEEQARRLAAIAAGGESSVVCLRCKYPLRGLTTAKCPECGTEYTLDELFAGQPARAAVGIE